MIAAKPLRQVLGTLLVLGDVFVHGAILAAEKPDKPAVQGGVAELDATVVVRELAVRSARWVTAPADLEKLEYDFFLGSEVTRIRVQHGQLRPDSVWMGATLHAGFQSVVRFPDKYKVTLTSQPGAKTITLLAKLKNPTQSISVQIGNGVENSWRGYYTHTVPKRPSSWTPNGLCRSRNRPA